MEKKTLSLMEAQRKVKEVLIKLADSIKDTAFAVCKGCYNGMIEFNVPIDVASSDPLTGLVFDMVLTPSVFAIDESDNRLNLYTELSPNELMKIASVLESEEYDFRNDDLND